MPYPVPRETLIPGTPGMAGGVHLMINAFALLQNQGLGSYSITNPGVAGSFDGGATRPQLQHDWLMGYAREEHGRVEGLLMLDLEPPARAERLAALTDLSLSLAEFTRWCDEVLEQSTFRPEPRVSPEATDDGADVHVTPLARAMLRPFAAVVLPGCDARLGAWPMPEGLLPREAAAAGDEFAQW